MPHRVPGTSEPWLDRIRRIQAIAQAGLAFATDPFDEERYGELQRLAVEMLGDLSHGDPSRVADLFVGDSGYPTPKIDVRAVVVHEGRVLLVRERADGCWTLPGGWAEVGVSPREAVEKEVREESGFEVRATRAFALYDRDRHEHPPIAHHAWKLFVLCDLIGGGFAENVETSGADFFALDQLPPLSTTRVTEAQIRRVMDLAARPDASPDLD